MKNPEEFCKELEALMIKYEVDQSISIYPMEGMTRMISYSVRKEEEPEMAEIFHKFAQTIGKVDTSTIKAITDILEVLFEEQQRQEKVISQVTWEKMAYDNAERFLSEEDHADLENAMILKLAAVEANEWELAAQHRQEELRLLNKVMDLINQFD